jgi:hypothetical protein
MHPCQDARRSAWEKSELVLEGDKARLLSTTDLQTFGLIVAAGPYFAVPQPSDVVRGDIMKQPQSMARNQFSGGPSSVFCPKRQMRGNIR